LDKRGIRLGHGEEAHYRQTFTPEEEGIYILHAYLFEGPRRIDHRREYVSVSL